MLSEEGGAVIVAVTVEFVVVFAGGEGGDGVGVVAGPAAIGASSGCNSSAMTCES